MRQVASKVFFCMFSHHYKHVPPQSLPRTGYSAAHLLWLIAIHFPHITPPLHLCSIFTLSHHLLQFFLSCARSCPKPPALLFTAEVVNDFEHSVLHLLACEIPGGRGGGWNREHPRRLMTFMLFREGPSTRAKETYALVTQPTAMWPCSNVWTPVAQ